MAGEERFVVHIEVGCSIRPCSRMSLVVGASICSAKCIGGLLEYENLVPMSIFIRES